MKKRRNTLGRGKGNRMEIEKDNNNSERIEGDIESEDGAKTQKEETMMMITNSRRERQPT